VDIAFYVDDRTDRVVSLALASETFEDECMLGSMVESYLDGHFVSFLGQDGRELSRHKLRASSGAS
jgi:hypothetical protein